ncbi:glutaredoxin domain-containing cysteine-rich protein 1-like [Actinia tenebrosa]|uniref:Glutaredoxin domain-containing cysteine-rich protein 1-like n=1 Tax=Actinia tenebrosa TaxID=6105 RepID=A0A6P8IUQ5_ACTTE|nr:glutaredoxin domain-containing cysteine-rich protein 1-like [Actinia tenebrosa]
MKKRITTSLVSEIHRHSRPHGIFFNFHNPLSVGRSANFKLQHSKMDSLNSSRSSSISNGDVDLKSYSSSSSTSLEQNFENLRIALNGKEDEKKEEIVGPTGTVRGFKNIIKDRKKHLSKAGSMTALSEANEDSESRKIIFYSTSMGGIRSTIANCQNIRKIFQNLRLKVDERDIFMHKEYQAELDNRVGMEGTAVPQVFVNGHLLGGTKEITELNELGQLKSLLSDFEKLNGSVCETCGGYEYVNCTSCKGSKTSRKTRISREISVLKCTVCNENGLQRCPTCTGNSEQDLQKPE